MTLPAQTDPASWSAVDLLTAYRERKLSPVEATRAALDRIGRYNGQVNAFCLLDAEQALRAARASEERWGRGEPVGLLEGVPATVKELLLAEGWPTTRCSLATDTSQVWNEDAPSVARLRRHGAVLLGKTTSPEFGCKGVTDSPRFGITRNPWDVSRTPGGSSGGAAVTAALGMGALHLGTDGGGSIRIPAAFTGIFGFKATYGRVPVYPPSAFGTTSHVGPMTRTVADAALMMDVLCGPEARDWLALPSEPISYRDTLAGGLNGVRIAYSPTLGYAKVDPEVASIVDSAVRSFQQLGASVELVEQPFDDPTSVFRKIWYSGVALAVAAIPAHKRSLMDPELLYMLEAGERLPHMEYMHATLERAKLGIRMNQFHEQFDLLITPAMPIAAFDVSVQVPDPSVQKNWIDWTPFTYPFNLTHQPAAVMPCGFTAAGLPVGMQIVAKVYADALVLRAAWAFESMQPIVLPPAPRASA